MGRGRVRFLDAENGDQDPLTTVELETDRPKANLLHRWKAEDELRDWQDAVAAGQKMADGS